MQHAHEEVIWEGNARWCAVCSHEHGPLYVCEHYSPELRAFLGQRLSEYHACLRDPKWQQEQINNGIPPVAIGVMQALAGIEDESA